MSTHAYLVEYAPCAHALHLPCSNHAHISLVCVGRGWGGGGRGGVQPSRSHCTLASNRWAPLYCGPTAANVTWVTNHTQLNPCFCEKGDYLIALFSKILCTMTRMCSNWRGVAATPVFVYAHIHTHTHMGANAQQLARCGCHTCVCVCTHTHTYTHGCECAAIGEVWLMDCCPMCVCVYVCIHKHTHTQTHTHTHTCIHTHQVMDSCAMTARSGYVWLSDRRPALCRTSNLTVQHVVYIRIHTYTHTHIHTYTHTVAPLYVIPATSLCSMRNIYVYTHAHIHTHTHTLSPRYLSYQKFHRALCGIYTCAHINTRTHTQRHTHRHTHTRVHT